MPRVTVRCGGCGKTIQRNPSGIDKHGDDPHLCWRCCGVEGEHDLAWRRAHLTNRANPRPRR